MLDERLMPLLLAAPGLFGVASLVVRRHRSRRATRIGLAACGSIVVASTLCVRIGGRTWPEHFLPATQTAWVTLSFVRFGLYAVSYLLLTWAVVTDRPPPAEEF